MRQHIHVVEGPQGATDPEGTERALSERRAELSAFPIRCPGVGTVNLVP